MGDDDNHDSMPPEDEPEAEENKKKEKKHDSGTADLEKVTDYAEEKEIIPTSNDLEDAIAIIREFTRF